jgi:hypothetical protein
MLALGNAEGFNFRTPIWLRICATPRLLTWAWAFRLLPLEKLRAAGEVEPWGGHPASPRCTAAAQACQFKQFNWLSPRQRAGQSVLAK